jgi:hypothetical protein
VVARRFSDGDASGAPDSCLPGSLVELDNNDDKRASGGHKWDLLGAIRSAATESRHDQMPRNVQSHLILVPAKSHTDQMEREWVVVVLTVSTTVQSKFGVVAHFI